MAAFAISKISSLLVSGLQVSPNFPCVLVASVAIIYYIVSLTLNSWLEQ